MFNKLDFESCSSFNVLAVSKKSSSIENLKNIIFQRFGKRKIEEGITEVYLVIPYENEIDYSEEEKKVLAQVLRTAEKKKEITSKNIHTIVWVVEYNRLKRECLNVFPVDRLFLMKIDTLAEVLDKSRVIRLT